MKNLSILVATSIILEILYSTQSEILTEASQCKDIECSQGKRYQLELINSLIAEETAKDNVATVSKNAVVTVGTGGATNEH